VLTNNAKNLSKYRVIRPRFERDTCLEHVIVTKTSLFLISVTFTIFPVLNMVEYETRERNFKIYCIFIYCIKRYIDSTH